MYGERGAMFVFPKRARGDDRESKRVRMRNTVRSNHLFDKVGCRCEEVRHYWGSQHGQTGRIFKALLLRLHVLAAQSKFTKPRKSSYLRGLEEVLARLLKDRKEADQMICRSRGLVLRGRVLKGCY